MQNFLAKLGDLPALPSIRIEAESPATALAKRVSPEVAAVLYARTLEEVAETSRHAQWCELQRPRSAHDAEVGKERLRRDAEVQVARYERDTKEIEARAELEKSRIVAAAHTAQKELDILGGALSIALQTGMIGGRNFKGVRVSEVNKKFFGFYNSRTRSVEFY